jgi:hypothetical protein
LVLEMEITHKERVGERKKKYTKIADSNLFLG